MTQKLWTWATSLLFVGAMMMGITSCGDDDDNGAVPSPAVQEDNQNSAGGLKLPQNVTLIKTTVPTDENSARVLEFFTFRDNWGFLNLGYSRYTAIPRPELSPSSILTTAYYVYPFFEKRSPRTDGKPNIFAGDMTENYHFAFDEQNGRYVVTDVNKSVQAYLRVVSKSETQCQIEKADANGNVVATETYEIAEKDAEYDRLSYEEYSNQNPDADDGGNGGGNDGGNGGGNGGGNDGGNGGGNVNDEWEALTASGYMPYYYCPTDRTTVPSYPRATTYTVYRNKMTGAYKITWDGVTYPANRGHNKITIGRDSHVTYNTTIKRYMSCTDYFYLEFTVY